MVDCASGPTPRQTAEFGKAAAAGDVEDVRALLNAGVDPNTADANGRTALMAAADIDDLRMMMLLLKAGADVNVKKQMAGRR